MRITPFILLCSAVAAPLFSQPAAKPHTHVEREVQHELLMLPRFGVFDSLSFKVTGATVTLMGYATRPVLKSDAENAVKGIETVTKVDNQIEVLPISTQDDALRIRLYNAIYGAAGMQKYAILVNPPIRIIVKNGNVTLEGVVDNEGDKNMANIKANGVTGTFSIKNNLRVG